jgi:hypothetical protein
VACTGGQQTFAINNLGQTQHFLVVNTNSAQFVTARLEGIQNGSTYQMSDSSLPAAATGGVVIGSGYFPLIQANIQCLPGAGTFTLNYTGTWGTPTPDVGFYLQTNISKMVAQGAPANTDFGRLIRTPYGNSQGTLLVQYVGGVAAGGSFTIACNGASLTPNSLTMVVLNVPLASTTSTQTFAVPQQPCVQITASFTNSGAAGIINVEYQFTKPGYPPGTNGLSLSSFLGGSAVPVTGPGNWTAVSTPAAGSQATATQAAGTGTLRHVANCITWSAGAAAAPAATTLTINLRDGATGVGTILWSTNVTAAATAANHGNISFCGLNRVGSAATAMTLEFAAGLANESESVTLSGYDVQ